MPTTSVLDYINQNIESIILSVKKLFAWLLPSVLGVSTKLAYESRTKKITVFRVLTSFIMAVFIGYMCDKICTHYGWYDLRGIIVSIGALSSEAIVQYVLQKVNKQNITAALKRFFNIKASSNDNDKPTAE